MTKRGMLETHSTTLENYQAALVDHSSTLHDHSSRLDDQQTALADHSSTLHDHSSRLDDQQTALAAHSTTLDDHSGTLHQHADQISQLQQLQPQTSNESTANGECSNNTEIKSSAKCGILSPSEKSLYLYGKCSCHRCSSRHEELYMFSLGVI